jgi:hypothetical protein
MKALSGWTGNDRIAGSIKKSPAGATTRFSANRERAHGQTPNAAGMAPGAEVGGRCGAFLNGHSSMRK